jgi:hypothetical protein
MDKFLQKIQEHFDILNEQDPPPIDTDPVDAAGDIPPEMNETPDSALPDEVEGDDDVSKLKIDYVEMIRKALIMAPKHIDDVDYAKLTKVADTDNIDEMHELVTRIVRNNYPHPDFEV